MHSNCLKGWGRTGFVQCGFGRHRFLEKGIPLDLAPFEKQTILYQPEQIPRNCQYANIYITVTNTVLVRAARSTVWESGGVVLVGEGRNFVLFFNCRVIVETTPSTADRQPVKKATRST